MLFSASGVAQPLPDEAARRDEARELFTRGEVAFAEGRLADARRLFRESLELHPHQATAFNLALAMREAGAYVDSDALYAELLEGRYGVLEDDRRAEVQSLRAEVRSRIGLLRVRVRVHDVVRIDVLVDGRLVARGPPAHAVEAEVDPGEHVVTARAVDHLPVDETVLVDAGDTVEVRLALTEPARRASAGPGRDGTGDASPWLWIALAVALAAGGAVAAILLLTGDDEEDLPADLVFGRATTLRW